MILTEEKRMRAIQTIGMMYTYLAGLDPTIDSEERRIFIDEATLKAIEIEQRYKRN